MLRQCILGTHQKAKEVVRFWSRVSPIAVVGEFEPASILEHPRALLWLSLPVQIDVSGTAAGFLKTIGTSRSTPPRFLLQVLSVGERVFSSPLPILHENPVILREQPEFSEVLGSRPGMHKDSGTRHAQQFLQHYIGRREMRWGYYELQIFLLHGGLCVGTSIRKASLLGCFYIPDRGVPILSGHWFWWSSWCCFRWDC